MTSGLFTSPHLVRYNERIRVGGREVARRGHCSPPSREIDAARGDISLTFFEWNTLAALVTVRARKRGCRGARGRHGRAARRRQPARRRRGGGGLGRPRSPGMARRHRRGDRRREGRHLPCRAARDLRRAADAGKRRGPRRGDRRAAPPHRHATSTTWSARTAGTTSASVRGAANCRCRRCRAPASLAMRRLRSPCSNRVEPALLVPDEAVRAGLAAVRLPGRFQVIPGQPEWILDVAHNAEAARVARREPRGPAPCGGARSRSAASSPTRTSRQSSRPLAPRVHRWIAVGLDGPRALLPAELARRIRAAGAASVVAVADVAAGLAQARGRMPAGRPRARVRLVPHGRARARGARCGSLTGCRATISRHGSARSGTAGRGARAGRHRRAGSCPPY